MFVIKHKNILFTISGVLMLAAVVALLVFGLNVGIDFTGGSILEVSYSGDVPTTPEIEEAISGFVLDSASIRKTGDSGYIIRTRFLNEEEHAELTGLLTFDGSRELVIERQSSVGPTIGSELRSKALIAIAIVVIAIIFFVAFAFRKVSRPVRSWKYGLAAVIALVHDTLIPVGVFAVLGATIGTQADALFVMALLAILGYSVNDTIVVFDRVRENLGDNKEHNKKEAFGDVVGRSLSQTYARSLNTSLTTLIVLLALFFIGGPSVHSFVLTLIVGVVAGTYSSIFLASPLLVLFAGERDK